LVENGYLASSQGYNFDKTEGHLGVKETGLVFWRKSGPVFTGFRGHQKFCGLQKVGFGGFILAEGLKTKSKNASG